MALTTYYRRLHALLCVPEQVYVGTVGADRWVTDGYVLVDVAAVGASPAVAGLDEGSYRIRRTVGLVSTRTDRAAIVGADAARLIASWRDGEWVTLTPTKWAVCTSSKSQLSHARVLLQPGEELTFMNSDLLHRWETGLQPGELFLEQARGKPGTAIRVSVAKSYESQREGRQTYPQVAGYIMPVNPRQASGATADLNRFWRAHGARTAQPCAAAT